MGLVIKKRQPFTCHSYKLTECFPFVVQVLPNFNSFTPPLLPLLYVKYISQCKCLNCFMEFMNLNHFETLDGCLI